MLKSFHDNSAFKSTQIDDLSQIQEIIFPLSHIHLSREISLQTVAGSDQGQRDGISGRGGLLQGQQRHRQCGQRGERSPQHQVHSGVVRTGGEKYF